VVKPLILALAVVVSQTVESDRISQQEFKQLFAAKNVTIVDVRDESSFNSAHIPGAILLTDHDVSVQTPAAEKVIAQLKASKSPVVVYCACGGDASSLRVAKILRDRGIMSARALAGGWVDWFNGGNPVVGGK
jgi:rhodanese-related sulfurtransferase